MAEQLGATQERRRHGLMLMAAALLPLLLITASASPADGVWHETIEFLGKGLIFACLLGRATSVLYIGGRKCAELVTVGPYSICRNPLYLFSLLGVIGVGCTFGSLLLGTLFGLLYFLVFDRLIAREEHYLRDRFAQAFDTYCRHTPRWWPRLSLWRSVDQVMVRPALVFRTVRDASLFVLTVPLIEGIEWMQQAGTLPVLFRLP